MKDTAPFDVRKARQDKEFYRSYILDDFIKKEADRAREDKDNPVGKYLGCFSTKQLADFCREGSHKTKATEQKVREELINRIEVGDRVMAVPFDVVKTGLVPAVLWHTVTARNARQIRLDFGGWYSKNNILWFQMFNKEKGEDK